MLQSDDADAPLCPLGAAPVFAWAWGLTEHGRAASRLSRSVVATGWHSSVRARSPPKKEKKRKKKSKIWPDAAIAQLGERQTEDLKVPGSIPGLGKKSWTHVAK